MRPPRRAAHPRALGIVDEIHVRRVLPSVSSTGGCSVSSRRTWSREASSGTTPRRHVQLDLRVQGVGEQAIARIEQRHAGLVAGGLDSEDQHAGTGAELASGRGKTLILCVVSRHHFDYPPMPIVRVKENEPFDVALRRFKRAVEKTGLLTELRAREFYEKPTAERKRKHAAAVKRRYKRMRAQMLPPKLY